MQAIGIGLIIGGIGSYFFPGFNGFFFEPSNMTTGEGQILGAVLFVGGLILIAIDRKSKE